MASLYKRGEKYWIKMHRPNQRTKPDRIPTGTGDLAMAKAMLESMVGDKAKNLPVNPKAYTIEFWQLAEAVLEDYENEGYTSLPHAKGRFMNHICPALGHMIAMNMTEGDLRRYRTQRRHEGAKPATIRHELELIKRAFTLGQREHRIVGPYVELPEVQNARKGFFEKETFTRVYNAIEPVYRPFLYFAYVTGWRTGEIKDLRRRHLDFTNKVIRLDPGTTKNGDARVFPMIEGLDEMLAAQVARPGFPEDYVFTYQKLYKSGKGKSAAVRARAGSPIGQPKPIGDFGKAFAMACYKAGLPCDVEPWEYTDRWGNVHSGERVMRAHNVPHDFRRSAVMNLTRMQVPEKVSMDLCGHRTREVFDRYRIVTQNDIDVAAAKMAAAYKNLIAGDSAGTIAGTISRLPRKRVN
jgi:integrase